MTAALPGEADGGYEQRASGSVGSRGGAWGPESCWDGGSGYMFIGMFSVLQFFSLRQAENNCDQFADVVVANQLVHFTLLLLILA